jgi:DNA-binding transcriptional ArsR family regulator
MSNESYMQEMLVTSGKDRTMEEELVRMIAGVFSAIAHPNRIKILEFLRDGEKCNCEIYPALGLEQSNLSRHLKALTDIGLLASRREGVSIYYRVTDERVFGLLDEARKIIREKIKSEVHLLEVL